MIYLFLAVSTAFIITVPFVSGNLTYSNLGAGCNGADAFPDFEESPANDFEPGLNWSSERREEKAFVIIFGKNL